jgi:hypothetical protein
MSPQLGGFSTFGVDLSDKSTSGTFWVDESDQSTSIYIYLSLVLLGLGTGLKSSHRASWAIS